MNHILVPAAIIVLAVGAAWSIVGWVVHNYAQSVPASVSKWFLGAGLAVLGVGVLLYIWPVILVFGFARPA